MTIRELLHNLRERLIPSMSDLAQSEAEAIIEQTLNITKALLYINAPKIVDKTDLKRIEQIMERRLRGEPLQYIFGKAFFYDREFFIDENVLIPRPDTETLVEAVINTEKDDIARFIDIGTGSGILAAVLTAHRPGWTAVAIDVSYKALKTAARNCSNGNIHILCCDMFGAIKPEKQFDFIVGNPPYISSAQMAGLDKSVVNYEPHTALRGGDDGLDYYRTISSQAKMYLKDSGRLYLEIGYDQGVSVPKIFTDDDWKDIAIIKDLGDRNRVVLIKF
ncbi:MAG: peptide chain release factor N(5)-glutamine methyltransferase [Chitinispirillales bacterium]|jgi:release factor glutamine methyltransferase|nr:peptide chain release factor N(5)-glutamine methyltransferase [Chitinispirillales bacterium]